MNIRMDISGTVLNATLEDNPTALDFAALLPLRLPLEDYASIEKIGYLPKRLSTEDDPDRIDDPRIGDLTYYAPWGNLAIFHGNYRHSAGLIRIGHIERDLDVLRAKGPVEAKIDLVD